MGPPVVKPSRCLFLADPNSVICLSESSQFKAWGLRKSSGDLQKHFLTIANPSTRTTLAWNNCSRTLHGKLILPDMVFRPHSGHLPNKVGTPNSDTRGQTNQFALNGIGKQFQASPSIHIQGETQWSGGHGHVLPATVPALPADAAAAALPSRAAQQARRPPRPRLSSSAPPAQAEPLPTDAAVADALRVLNLRPDVVQLLQSPRQPAARARRRGDSSARPAGAAGPADAAGAAVASIPSAVAAGLPGGAACARRPAKRARLREGSSLRPAGAEALPARPAGAADAALPPMPPSVTQRRRPKRSCAAGSAPPPPAQAAPQTAARPVATPQAAQTTKKSGAFYRKKRQVQAITMGTNWQPIVDIMNDRRKLTSLDNLRKARDAKKKIIKDAAKVDRKLGIESDLLASAMSLHQVLIPGLKTASNSAVAPLVDLTAPCLAGHQLQVSEVTFRLLRKKVAEMVQPPATLLTLICKWDCQELMLRQTGPRDTKSEPAQKLQVLQRVGAFTSYRADDQLPPYPMNSARTQRLLTPVAVP